MRRHGASVVLALLVALLLGSCGLGEGEPERGGGAELRITRDFGQERLQVATLGRVTEGQTVMRFLRSVAKVETRYGGGFVQSIDGLSGSARGGRRDWFYFVNGIEAPVGAAERRLAPGDVVQWDYRRWDAAMRVPAIVGAYPEPFVHGSEGKRIPVRIECDEESSGPCRGVKSRLRAQRVPVTSAAFGTAGGPETIRVVVARWAAARDVQAARLLEAGPERSGVFARFANEGRTLELLDETGRTLGSAPAGTGLIAATALPEQSIVWLVTGIDERGVAAAARSLEERTLRDAFAVAATPAGPVRLPARAG